MTNEKLLLYLKWFDYQDGFQHWVKGTGFDLREVFNLCDNSDWLLRIASFAPRHHAETHSRMLALVRDLTSVDTIEARIFREIERQRWNKQDAIRVNTEQLRELDAML